MSPTGHLHDGLVDRPAIGDGLFGGFQHPAVVRGHDGHELLRLDGPVGQQPGRHLRAGLHLVEVDAVPQPDAVLVTEWLEVHHVVVVDPGQVTVGVVDQGDPAGHAGAEVPARRPEDHHPSPGHVLTGVVADALDHGDGAGVADTEPLPHLPPQEDLARRRPVEDDVAGDDVLLGGKGGVLGRGHDDPATRQTLAQVVVGVAEEPHGHPLRHKGPEALARRAPEGQVDGAVGQACPAVAAGDLVAQQGPDGAVHVGHGHLGRHRGAVLDGRTARLEEAVVEGLVQPVVLVGHPVSHCPFGGLRGQQDGRQVDARRLPVVDGHRRVDQVDPPDRLLEGVQAQRGQVLANLFGDVLEEGLDELRGARVALPEHRVLGGDPDRAGVEVTDPHHDATRYDQRGGGEAVLLGTEEYGFATAPLVVSGCIMMRVCHLDTCPVGIATQNPVLRERYTGTPEFVETFFEYIAEEVREYLAALGLYTLEEAVGRVDLVDAAVAVDHWKASGIDLAPILLAPEAPEGAVRHRVADQDHGLDKALDHRFLEACRPAIEDGTPVTAEVAVTNVDRTVGTLLGYEITRRYGGAGLPDGTIDLTFRGSAGQSFGAFVPKGVTMRLFGDTNDYLGKGLSGGRIIVAPSEDAPFAAEENIIAGNVILYGATSGEVFLRGQVGERFCVRNSGAIAVVE